MAVGDLITAQRYNDMLETLRKVLGNGGGEDGETYGYGQTIDSVNKITSPTADIVYAQDMVNLLNDINKAVTHQSGEPSQNLIQILQGDIIADDISDDTIVASGDGDKKGYVDFENEVIALEQNRADAYDNAYETYEPAQSTTTDWRGNIQHIVSMQFAGGYSTVNTDGSSHTATGADHYRHFFNAGGAVVFNASVAAVNDPVVVTQKTDNWSQMLSAMADVIFSRDKTVSSNASPATQFTGAFALGVSTSWTNIFTKAGSSNYAENTYTVEARRPTADRLEFKITLNDLDPTDADIDTPGYSPSDEYVTGTTSSTVGFLVPDGSVTVPKPVKFVNTTFTVTAG